MICDLTDLDVEVCGCPTHRPPVNVPFAARHQGICSRCHQEFEVGTKIRENELGQYKHASHL